MPKRKVLFVRVGWMRFYNGQVPGDERPVGGGEYNKNGVGHEVYNFQQVHKSLYGYFQPATNAKTVNLTRIDPNSSGKDSVSGVDVIMVARRPEGGQVIIGWYKNAKVFRNEVLKSPHRPKGYGYFCESLVKDSVLLPEVNRKFEIIKNKGGIGQANVCYILDGKGKPKEAEWIPQAIRYIDSYQAGNILEDPAANAETEVEEIIERTLARSQGQGFAHNPKERRALEERAMKAAQRYFENKGYVVEDVSARSPYDLLCSKGSNALHVEVKGTTTNGRSVTLTRNEVHHALDRENFSVLFIFHSMRLEKERAIGGKALVISRWYPHERHLRPIAYTYEVPSKTSG